MFSKVFLFALLCLTLVVAGFAEEKETVEEKTEKTTDLRIEEVLKEADNCVQDAFKENGKPFEDALNDLKKRDEKPVGINMKKWMELKDIYNQINRNAQEAIEERKELLESRLEDLRKVGIDITEAGKKKIEQLKEESKKLFEEQKVKWDAKLNAWRDMARKVIQATKDKGPE